MPIRDVITLPLELPGLEVVDQSVGASRELVIVVQYSRASGQCPRCGRVSVKVHDRRVQECRDLPLRGQTVVLHLVKRRFCLWCGLSSQSGRWRPFVFAELHEVFGRGPKGGTRRTTPRLRQRLAEQTPHQTVKRLAEEMGVGQRFVRECFRDWARMLIDEQVPGGHTPEWLGVDEYSLRKGRRYETIVCDLVCDLKERRVLASLPGRDGQSFQEWLEQLDDPWGVAVATMDMSNTYREVVELCLPGAKIVADRFHVVRRVGKALGQVRLRLQRKLGQERRGELYELRYVLLTDQAKWTDEERRCLRRLFKAQPELHQAWKLRERFRHWYETEDRLTAERLLTQWEDQVRQSGIGEFIQLSQGANAMLVEWREEILNYFDAKLTNGFVEGKNNRTKAIQRQAYGYSNPANLRMRILLPKTP